MSTEQTPTPAGGFPYTLTRTLDAPAARVWQAWTTPDQYARWSHAAPGSVELDVRPGGPWKATMITPDGAEFPLTGTYLQVTENRHLTIGMDVPGRPDPATMTVELTEEGPRNTVIVLSQTCDTAEERDMAEQGSGMLLDGLEGFLADGSRG
ncbi:putative glutathione S-transferase-related transmembrane protein [Streptomyces ambofaciens ATCC 23877]|uniref:Putative glutathione S-transferase-related transmembrane protein n=1 Tax=Streptomyces ambofaciens (strain ATCC 23877 / 3486 / DSM 40053 / JCM 4204 / NBRC 12836 / NRRL B-2516) TaxID=278992 RepID=A0A0K2AS53_STRA7|nr:SRPBCC domain-containing protein [Streptomyces ambofaciens]AKZ55955.1 putative glutathione S-transferase-related transmembrane protein [Streptomyces ambofaciens ATCC 23877]